MKNRSSILTFLCLVLFLSISLSSCNKIQTSFKFMAAQTAYNRAEFKKAIELYKELIELNPDDPMLYFNLGTAYYSDNNLLRCRKQAIKLKKMKRKDLAENLEQLIEEEM